jgi:fatty acid desaturase
MSAIARLFLRYDGPTWLVAVMLYGSWAALVWYHARLPWWVIAPLGAYLVAWHFSLQHEAIHSFLSAPKWLRWAVVMPPLGLWLPFPLYYEAHRKHHQNTHLTEPGVDTESFYVRRADWAAMRPERKALLLANQTLAGRVLLGPLLRLEKLARLETARLRRREFSHVPHWIVHAALVAALFWRTAITESGAFWSLLFLNNNLHAAHHLHPKMAWWRLPAYWRANRVRLLAHNGNYFFPGYGEIARRWLFEPVFVPAHPRW